MNLLFNEHALNERDDDCIQGDTRNTVENISQIEEVFHVVVYWIGNGQSTRSSCLLAAIFRGRVAYEFTWWEVDVYGAVIGDLARVCCASWCDELRQEHYGRTNP